jgi:hypothetical protein
MHYRRIIQFYWKFSQVYRKHILKRRHQRNTEISHLELQSGKTPSQHKSNHVYH